MTPRYTPKRNEISADQNSHTNVPDTSAEKKIYEEKPGWWRTPLSPALRRQKQEGPSLKAAWSTGLPRESLPRKNNDEGIAPSADGVEFSH